MRVLITKRGDSTWVRIPAAVIAAAHPRLDKPVDVRAVYGRIVIEPVRGNTYDLVTLVAAITDENRPAAVDMGPRAGREAWPIG